MYGTLSKALGAAVSEYSLEDQKRVLREWNDWNGTVGRVHDIRPLLDDGLGVCVNFVKPIEARHFMNSVYDRLIESVRRDCDKNCKP